MRLSENAQELLEQLWIAAEEDKTGGIPADPSVTGGAEDLVKHKLARHEGNKLCLTAEGRPEAAGAIRRHRLAERLLADVLVTDQSQIDEQACRLEHALVEGLDESICTLLGHPTFCPHGKPIPQGNCCKQMRDSVRPVISPLRELKDGEHGQIAYIQMNDPRRLSKLMAMGILPGTPITLLRRSPSYVFEAGYSQFAVDEEIAGDVFVRVQTD